MINEEFVFGAVNIRRARPSDRHRVIALIDAVCRERRYLYTPCYTPTPEWERLLATGSDAGAGMLLYVVTSGEAIVGMARLFPDRRPVPDRHIGSIGLVVTRPWRNRGIGTFLLAVLLKNANLLAYHSLRADILMTNQRSQHLFRKHGFVEISRQEIFWPITNRLIDEITVERQLLPIDFLNAGSLNEDGGHASATISTAASLFDEFPVHQ